MPAGASDVSSATTVTSSQVEATASANLDTLMIVKRLAEQDKKLDSIARRLDNQNTMFTEIHPKNSQVI